jgi:hypothetical protein
MESLGLTTLPNYLILKISSTECVKVSNIVRWVWPNGQTKVEKSQSISAPVLFLSFCSESSEYMHNYSGSEHKVYTVYNATHYITF